jgi:hypothetical protein
MTRSFFVVVVMESAAKEFAAVAEEGFARIVSGFARIFLRCFGDKKKKEGEKEGEIEGEKKKDKNKTKGRRRRMGERRRKSTTPTSLQPSRRSLPPSLRTISFASFPKTPSPPWKGDSPESFSPLASALAEERTASQQDSRLSIQKWRR